MAHMQYWRHARRRKFRGVDRGENFGHPRLRKAAAFLAERNSVLFNTGIIRTGVATPATNQIEAVDHQRTTGDGPMRVTTTGTHPAPLDFDSLTWVRVLDANTYKLYYSRADAVNDRNEVDITSAGTGTTNYGLAGSVDGLKFFVVQGVHCRQLRDAVSMEEVQQ